MGTSGAYGGSDRQGWNRTRDLVHDLADSGSSGDTDHAPANGEPGDDPRLGEVWQAIAAVLTGEDPLLGGPSPTDQMFPLPDLLPRPRVPRGGGGGPGGVVRGTTGAAGRRGFRSTRAVMRGAARGGAAIGGAYALLRGDAPGLADLGLDLTELRTLGPRMQCALILEKVIGDGGHPDDTALRRAAAEALKEIILSGKPPSEIEALRGFVGHYVFQICLVEIQGEVTGGSMDPAEAASVEKRLHDYLEARVRILDFPHEGTLSIARFKEAAAKLTQDAIRVLRAGREAA
jgi:hypothetical protein